MGALSLGGRPLSLGVASLARVGVPCPCSSCSGGCPLSLLLGAGWSGRRCRSLRCRPAHAACAGAASGSTCRGEGTRRTGRVALTSGVGVPAWLGGCPLLGCKKLDRVRERIGHLKARQPRRGAALRRRRRPRRRVLLDFGADPNVRDAVGRAPLHLVAARGTGREAIRALVGAGADVEACDAAGHTPLALARQASRRVAEKELAALGALR